MSEKTKSKVPNKNGRNGKPVSLHPLTRDEALKRAMQADPKKIPKVNGK